MSKIEIDYKIAGGGAVRRLIMRFGVFMGLFAALSCCRFSA
ncbi:hypothetical protein [Candidatus Tokpelaia sp.]|nr:hypothetical protein [Candidatus Tokpelaia sp.]